MANPLVVEIPEGVVTKIATNVTAGYVRNLNRLTPLLLQPEQPVK